MSSKPIKDKSEIMFQKNKNKKIKMFKAMEKMLAEVIW